MIATGWDNVPENQATGDQVLGPQPPELAGKLHIERLELAQKIEKLKTFMTISPDFKNVGYFHKRLLDSQLTTMQNYENILVQRMTDLNNPDKNED